MCYNQTGDITTLDGASLKLVDKFTYLGSSMSSTEKNIDTRLTKAWTAIDRLSIIRKSDLTDKMKRSFFQAAVVSILLYGCTTWTLTKRLKNKLDGNYTRMLRAILNKSWRQHPTRHQLYGHLPSITKTRLVRRTRHTGHCWRSKDELISDVLLWTPAYGQAKAERPALVTQSSTTHSYTCPVGWGCRIHRLHLCRGEDTPHNECPRYDTKQTDDEVRIMLKLCGMRSTSPLLSLPSPLWLGVVAPDRVLCMGQIKQKMRNYAKLNYLK